MISGRDTVSEGLLVMTKSETLFCTPEGVLHPFCKDQSRMRVYFVRIPFKKISTTTSATFES